MQSDEDDFYGMQPSSSGLILSHMNNKSSVLCPETQDITSQYLVLQQLDAHQKMISRAKGCVDTRPPKSMQSYRSISSRKKTKLLNQMNYETQSAILNGDQEDEHRRPITSRLPAYNSEDEVESTNVSTVHKGIQTGIPASDVTCKTAEKISWYLEALSLGELQYFAFMDGSNSCSSKEYNASFFPSKRERKKIIKGDIMDWHREHFVKPTKPFSPRILAGTNAKSKIREMRCYNPPFRKKKISQSHSTDTFESYDEEDDEDEVSQLNEQPPKSDNSSLEEETLINKRQLLSESHHTSSMYRLPRNRRNNSNYAVHTALNKNEEDKYLDFLSKVTEDILKKGVYSDKAIQQTFEFHLHLCQEDSNKEKLQLLLQQVLEGLQITDEENPMNRSAFLFPNSRPNTPPEKESSTSGFSSDAARIPAELNSIASESVNNVNELNLDNS